MKIDPPNLTRSTEVSIKVLTFENLIRRTAAILKIEKLLHISWNYTMTYYTNLTIKTANINIKNCSLSVVLTATDQKPKKNIRLVMSDDIQEM